MAKLNFPTPPRDYTSSVKAVDGVLSSVADLLKRSPKAAPDAIAQIEAYRLYINRTPVKNSLKKIGFPSVKNREYAGNISWLRTALNTLAAISDKSPKIVPYLNQHITYYNSVIGSAFVPANVLTLNGEAIILNGEFVTFG